MIVDARGHRCPTPTLKLRRALETAGEVTLLADDPLARIDVPHFAGQIGAELVSVQEDGATLTFVVRRRRSAAEPAAHAAEQAFSRTPLPSSPALRQPSRPAPAPQASGPSRQA